MIRMTAGKRWMKIRRSRSDRGVAALLPTLGIAGGFYLDQQDESLFVPRAFVTGGLLKFETASIKDFS
ncbi:hypothetical protein AN403_6018 [Pseudomonas fluorescens]|uniref:Uncharacterized protein n=1 Tax=Pseudomonas fluorescens TaxID=294 RepID=A0A0P9BFL8_PSEFL|nr:hypothetical protein AN403_6018 [Pseudomonas fluorescens]